MSALTSRAVRLTCCIFLASCARHESAPATAATTPPGIQYEAHVQAGGRASGGAELNNPLHGNPSAARDGAALFVAMNCDGCHGGDGSGWVGPSLADGRWRYGGADPEVFSSIYFGRPKGMPAFGGTLGSTAIWSIVAYLQSLTPPASEATESFEQ